VFWARNTAPVAVSPRRAAQADAAPDPNPKTAASG
jgi:hypothetical protein